MPIDLDAANDIRELATSTTGKAINQVTDTPEHAALLERMDKDPEMKKKLAEMEMELSANKNLATEVLSLMFNDEAGYLWGADPDFRYIDLEQEPIFRYDLLRRAGDTEAARLIKNHRSLQLMDFAKPSSSKLTTQAGFTLVFQDPNYQPKKEEKQKLDQYALLLTQSFFYPPFSDEPNFANFLKVCYEDWFDLDDISIEIRRTRDNSPLGLHLCDPQYIKPIIYPIKDYHRYDRDSYEKFMEDPMIDPQRDSKFKDEQGEPYKYIFEKKKQRYAKFTGDRMIKAHFFVSSDFKRTRRGRSIVAQGVRVLTYILNALSMNSSNFTLNRTPQGILALTGGSVSPVQLEKIRKLFYAYSTGAANHNRIPLMSTPDKGDVKWVNIRNNNREMEYHLWMSLLFSLWAQLSGTDPEEVSLASNKQTMQKGGLAKMNEERIFTESKDNGLRMFLKHIENAMNRLDSSAKNVWQQITELPVMARFTGLEQKNEKLQADLDQKRLATDTSINDLLESQDKERQDIQFAGYNICDIRGLAMPQLFTALNTLQQAQQQKEQAEQQAMDQQAQAGQAQMTPEDQDIISKYGAPEEAPVEAEEEVEEIEQ